MLTVDKLRVEFDHPGGQRVVAVDEVSFEVRKGETFAVIGESGSGKTLTALSLLGLQPPMAHVTGSVVFQAKQIANLPEASVRRIRGRQVGFVYQNPLNAMNPVWTIGEQITETMRAHGVAARRDAEVKTIELLRSVHISEPQRVAAAYPHQVSGGMLQRAVIAMALACGPALLIADEPTTALDVTIKAQIMELLGELRERLGLTVILITHDMSVVADFADTVMVMYAGRAVELGPADRLMHSPAHHYAAALISTATIADQPWRTALPVIPGSAPSLDDRPPGCAFHPRCPAAHAVCAQTFPDATFRDDHMVACHRPLTNGVR